MAKTYNFLAIDLGATSGRGVLATYDGSDFSMEEVYRFPNAILEIGGKFYWNVFGLFEHVKAALKAAAKKGVAIDSIGVDTWGVDFGCIGEDGSILGLPRAYRDPYTVGVPEKVFEVIPREEVYSIAGIQVINFNTLFQLKAQKDEGFAPLKHAKNILFMPDLISYLLTGNMVCEYTDASTSNMMNQTTRQFEKSLLDRLGIDSSILLPIVQPGIEVGKLRKSIADETGIGEIPVIAVAGHDTASAIAAVPAANEEFAYLSSGTWSLMGIETPAPVISDKSCELNFTNEGGIEGTTRFLKNITGMWLLEQSKKVWAAQGRVYSYAELEKMAIECSDYKSVVNPDDPRLANPVDMIEAIKGIVAEKGERAPETDGELVSCIYHSLANRYKEIIAQLQEFAPFKISKLHIIGGGSQNATLSQMTADAIGMPVVTGPTEATAIGNVMLQAKAVGLVKDRWEMRRIVADVFKVKTYVPSK